MGLPEILISFQQKASAAIQAGSRGLVAVLLDDDTKEQFLSPYRRSRDVQKEDWSEGNLTALKLAFLGEPQKVLAVRILKKEDGTDDLKRTLDEIMAVNMDYLAYPGFTSGQKQEILTFIKDSHAKGKKVKAVLPDCDADCEHVINVAVSGVTVKWKDTEYTESYNAGQYCCRIAGILAGLPLTRSCTYYGLDEVVNASLSQDPDSEIDAGKLIIIFDGEKYKIGRGVTSLTSVSEKKPEALKKIKIVEGMDVITYDIYSTFENEYVGKIVNSYDNKQLFVGAVNNYFRKMEGSVLDGNAENYVEVDAQQNRKYLENQGIDTTDMTEQELKEANTGSWMFLTGRIRFLDAAEDLKLTMFM